MSSVQSRRRKCKKKDKNIISVGISGVRYIVDNVSSNQKHQTWNVREKKADFINAKGDTLRLSNQFGLHMINYLEESNVEIIPKISKIIIEKGHYDCEFVRNMALSLIRANESKEITIDDRESKKIDKSNCDLVFTFYYLKNGPKILDQMCKLLPDACQEKLNIKNLIEKEFDKMKEKIQIQNTNGFQFQNTNGIQAYNTYRFRFQNTNGIQAQNTNGFQFQNTNEIQTQNTNGIQAYNTNGFRIQNTNWIQTQNTNRFQFQNINEIQTQNTSEIQDHSANLMTEDDILDFQKLDTEEDLISCNDLFPFLF